MATNPFDQFDAPASAANPFDQFDAPVVPTRTWGQVLTDRAMGVGAAGLDMIGSAVNMANTKTPWDNIPGGATAFSALETGAGLMGAAAGALPQGVNDRVGAMRQYLAESRAANPESQQPRSEFAQSFANTSGQYADAARSIQSEKEKATQQRMAEVSKEGFLPTVAELATNPSALATATDSLIPSLAAGGGAGRLAGGLMGAKAAGQTTAQIGAMSAIEGAGSGDGAYEAVMQAAPDVLAADPVYQRLLDLYEGDDTKARETLGQMARSASTVSGAASAALLQGIGQRLGLNVAEDTLLGRITAGQTGSRTVNAGLGGAKEFVGEAAQGAANQLSQNVGTMLGGAESDVMAGVGGAAALEGMAGLGSGLIAGALQTPLPAPRTPAEAGANAAEDALATARAANPPQPPAPPPVAPTAPPAASGGDTDIEAEIDSLLAPEIQPKPAVDLVEQRAATYDRLATEAESAGNPTLAAQHRQSATVLRSRVRATPPESVTDGRGRGTLEGGAGSPTVGLGGDVVAPAPAIAADAGADGNAAPTVAPEAAGLAPAPDAHGFIVRPDGKRGRIEIHAKGSSVLTKDDVGALTYRADSGTGDRAPLVMVLSKDGRLVAREQAIDENNNSTGIAWVPPTADASQAARDLLARRVMTEYGSQERAAIDEKLRSLVVDGATVPAPEAAGTVTTEATENFGDELALAEAEGLITPDERRSLELQRGKSNEQVRQANSVPTQPGLQADQDARTISGAVPRDSWATATHVRAASGAPAVIFRGSRDGTTRPESFDQLGASTGNPSASLGVWFSNDATDASRYGQVGEYRLDLRNPKQYDATTLPEFESAEEAAQFREELKAQGHDGIVLDFSEDGGPVQYVAFSPDQIIPTSARRPLGDDPDIETSTPTAADDPLGGGSASVVSKAAPAAPSPPRPAPKRGAAQGSRQALAGIARSGGLNWPAFAKEGGLDPALMRNEKGGGGMPGLMRRTGGMTPDDLRQALVDGNQLLPSAEIADAMDWLDRTLRGENIPTFDTADAMVQAQADRRQARAEERLNADPMAAAQRARARKIGNEPAMEALADFDAGLLTEPGLRAKLNEAENYDENMIPFSRRPANGGLLDAPTSQEAVAVPKREKDAKRNGQTGAGQTDMPLGKPAAPGEVTRGLSVPVLERLARSLFAGWANAPTVRVEAKSPDGEIEGQFDPATNTVTLYADALSSPARARWVAYHEVTGHYGVRGVLEGMGKGLGSFDRQLGRVRSNPTIDALARAIAFDRELDATNGRALNLATEEAMAELAAAEETGNWQHLNDRYGVTVPRSMRAGVLAELSRYWQAIKSLFTAIGRTGTEAFTDADWRALVQGARRYVREGVASAPTGGDARASTATDQTQTPAFRRSGAGGVQPSSDQPVMDSLKADAKALSDFLERQSGAAQSGGLVDVPATMVAHVVRMAENPQVLQSIVAALPVDVVDFLAGQKLSPQRALRDQSVLKNMLAVDGESPVSLGVNESVTGSLLRAVAAEGAKATGLARGAGDARAAGSANKIDGVSGAHAANDVTKSATFSRWFGDSKVVDADGNPLVVFHGTGDKNFDSFRTPSFFTPNREGAQWFASDRSLFPEEVIEDDAEFGRIFETYLSIKNPLDVRTREGAMEFIALARRAGVKVTVTEHGDGSWDFDTDAISQHSKYDGTNLNDLIYVPAVREQMSREGFDGLQANDVLANDEIPVWIPLRPEQIKSATGNAGTFDPNNPSILLSRKDRTPEQQAALTKAGLAPDTRTTIQRLRDLIAERWQSVRDLAAGNVKQRVFDRFHRMSAIEQDLGIGADESAYLSARLAAGLPSIMEGVMLYGAPEWQGGVLGQKAGTVGLLDALKPVQDDIDGWLGWMVGRRAQVLKRQGRENLMSDDDIAALLSLANGKETEFKQAAAAYLKIKSAVLDVAEQAGLINAASRATWDSVEYIPFYRADEATDTTLGPGTRKALSGQSSGIRQLKGGEQHLADPLGNIVRNFTRLIDASLKNNAMLEAVDQYGDTYFEKVGMSGGFEKIPLSQIKELLLDRGVPQSTIDAMPQDALTGLQKMWAVKPPSDDDVVRIMRDGQPEYYRVPDPELLRALTSFKSPEKHWAIQPAIFLKRLLTAGVTASPEFMVRNFIRDSGSAWVLSDDKFRLGWDSAAGALRPLVDDSDQRAMMLAGGSFIGGNIHGGSPDETAAALRRALRAKGLSSKQIEDHLATVARTPLQVWDKWQAIGSALENANRNAVYQAAIKAGRSPKEAAYLARDLMDFAMQGDSKFIQFFADVLPFFNARLQGLYKLYRQGGKKQLRKAMLLRAGSITAATVALWAWNSLMYADGYDELEEWDKDTYWHIAPGTAFHTRIPKPFELGVIFATAPERLARAVFGQDRLGQTAQSAWTQISGTLAMNPVPQAVMPIVELWANKSSFTGRPIESFSDQSLLPEARAEWYTSDTMKAIASVIGNTSGLSPKRLEHLWNGYTGTVGGYLLDSVDWLVRQAEGQPTRPELAWAELPALKALYRGDMVPKSTRYTTEFYELLDKANDVSGTIKEHTLAGKTERADALEAKWSWLLGERVDSKRAKAGFMHQGVRDINKARDRLSDIRKEIEGIVVMPGMTDTEKRQAIDKLALERNALTKQITTAFRSRQTRP